MRLDRATGSLPTTAAEFIATLLPERFLLCRPASRNARSLRIVVFRSSRSTADPQDVFAHLTKEGAEGRVRRPPDS